MPSTTDATGAPVGTHPPNQALGGVGLAFASVCSVQFGAAVAEGILGQVGAIGGVALRLTFAALSLAVVVRPWRARWDAKRIRTVLLFGLVFAAMNSSLYESISRLPLATAITLEFLGPLVLSLVTGKGWLGRVWALPAAAGVALLGGGLHPDDLLGVLFALSAGACWAIYILFARHVGQSGDPLVQLTGASAVGAVIVVPIGLCTAGSALWQPHVLWVGLLIGVLCSAIPYSLDILALRRLPTSVFGVLTAVNPAVSALAGWLVIGQSLRPLDLIGIVLVSLASVGVTVTARRAERSRAAALVSA
jgi:inner membrane transporter RhtA